MGYGLEARGQSRQCKRPIQPPIQWSSGVKRRSVKLATHLL